VKHVFVDTGAFFAVLVPEDLHHERARAIFTRASEERWQLVTTNIVVIETHALLLNRAHGGRSSALAFLDAIERDKYQIERVNELDESAAAALVRAHEDKTYSLCDAMSFVVMERLNITDAIAFDRHFAEYGRFALL
jgi:predicted nucleic acid-binding protein